jgi:hypothetical protein
MYIYIYMCVCICICTCESLVHPLSAEKFHAEGEAVGILVALLVHQLHVAIVGLLGVCVFVCVCG